MKCGREIEFNYTGKHYFEGRNEDTDWYIYCEETKTTQYFTSANELLVGTILEGSNINDVWDHVMIDCVL